MARTLRTIGRAREAWTVRTRRGAEVPMNELHLYKKEERGGGVSSLDGTG